MPPKSSKSNEAEFIGLIKAAFSDESVVKIFREALSINTLVNDLNKAKKTIEELKESLEFTGKEVVELKKELSSTKKEVRDLKSELDKKDFIVKSQAEKLDILFSKTDENEQYSRRNSVRISGIPETNEENTTGLALNLFNNAMKVKVNLCDIDRTHRVGNRENGATRPVLVKFTSYQPKQKLMRARGILKHTRPLPSTWTAADDQQFPVLSDLLVSESVSDADTDSTKPIVVPVADRIFINEDLTKTKAKLMAECRQLLRNKGIKETWSYDGAIFVKDNLSQVQKVNHLNDLKKFQNKK
jgi:hypothetical protein